MNTLVTLHIADIYRDPRMDIPTRMDWAKVPRILRGEWPHEPPPFFVRPDRETIVAWFQGALAAPWAVVDTEYIPETKFLTLVGLGYPDMPHGLQLDLHQNWGTFLNWYCDLAASRPVVFHNALADIPVLMGFGGPGWDAYKQYEDTMQAHAVLYPEWPHDLEFLASLHGRYPKMKHLAATDPLRYNQGDVLETISAWQDGILPEFAKDPASERIYRTQNLRLLPHIDESQRIGLRVNTERVLSALEEYSKKRDEAVAVAQSYCGYPINLGSDQQVARWLYGVEGHPVQKHKETRNPTVNKDAIAVLRGKVLPFDPQDEPSVEKMHERIAQGGHPLLEARAVFAGAEQVISHYLAPLITED